MLSLIERDHRVEDAAAHLASRPLRWTDVNFVYETIKGLVIA